MIQAHLLISISDDNAPLSMEISLSLPIKARIKIQFGCKNKKNNDKAKYKIQNGFKCPGILC
jgi:hypothetical protein